MIKGKGKGVILLHLILLTVKVKVSLYRMGYDLFIYNVLYSHSWSIIQHSAHTNKKYIGGKKVKI